MKYQVIDIPIAELLPSKFNPGKRTNLKNLGGLMGSIQRYGLPVPIVVTEQKDGFYEVGDGHRRLACLKAVGADHAPCVVWPNMTAQEIWSVLNAYQMGMTPSQWLEAVVFGLSIEQPEIPSRLQRDISDLTRIVSDETLWRIVDEGKSPSILTTARYVGRKVELSGDDDIRKIIEWFLDFDSQAKARAVITGDYDLDLLREAINDNRNLNFTIEIE